MKLGVLVGLGPGHIVLDGELAPPPQRRTAPNFRPISVVAKWLDGLRCPGDFVLDGEPATLPKKGAEPPPIFGPCPWWPNGWMDQDGTSHGGGPRSRPHSARWGPSSPRQKGGRPPNFRPISVVAKRLDASRCHLVWRYDSASATLC